MTNSLCKSEATSTYDHFGGLSTANILTQQHRTATKTTETHTMPHFWAICRPEWPQTHGSIPRTTSALNGRLHAVQCSGTTIRMTSHLDVHLLRNRGQLIPMLQRQNCTQGDLLHLAVCSLVSLDCSRPVSPKLCQCACLHRTYGYTGTANSPGAEPVFDTESKGNCSMKLESVRRLIQQQA